MKKTGLLVLLLASAAWAQDAANATAEVSEGLAPTTASFPTERVQTPTYADLYCAGFISKQTLPDANFVAGGLQTPTTTKFTRGDLIYLKGSGYTAGAEYEIVRALRDVNEYEMYPGQNKLFKSTGQPYEEVGPDQDRGHADQERRRGSDRICLRSHQPRRHGHSLRGEADREFPFSGSL